MINSFSISLMGRADMSSAAYLREGEDGRRWIEVSIRLADATVTTYLHDVDQANNLVFILENLAENLIDLLPKMLAPGEES